MLNLFVQFVYMTQPTFRG